MGKIFVSEEDQLAVVTESAAKDAFAPAEPVCLGGIEQRYPQFECAAHNGVCLLVRAYDWP